jgi:uncharacterized protein YdeI (YjbR/CyaY-like superfamily)
MSFDMASEPQQVEVHSRQQLRAWLEMHHAQRESVWLVVWKKHTPHHIPYSDIVDEALCFGWIDSQPRKLDADRSLVRLSPRKPRSGWSGVNKLKIERLMAAGLMAPPGLARIAQAQQDGSWEQLDSASSDEIPPDLAASFARFPDAATNFAAFPKSARRAILEWISTARTPETRSKRIAETAAAAAKGERANQWKKKITR